MSRQEFPAKVISGNRITIPPRAMARLKLSIGDELDVIIMKAKPLEKEEEAVGKCPECGLPATHPSGLCRDCHQSKLEA